jgi:prepilin-type N-terminal cleavage/methylation domain-containing protein
MSTQRFRRRRSGFTLIEALVAAMLLSICAAGLTSLWNVCYTMNDAARRVQAGKNILEHEMERVRRLNWGGLTEITAWTARYYYDASGQPVGAVGSASPATNGFTSYLMVETMNSDMLSLSQTPTRDTSGGNSRSLRRVMLRVQPNGVAAATDPPTAEAVTCLSLGGP